MDRDDMIPWLHDQMCKPGDEAYCGCAKCAKYAEAAAENRSLRAQVAQERAGIVVFIRQMAAVLDQTEYPEASALEDMADAIEAQKDKTT